MLKIHSRFFSCSFTIHYTTQSIISLFFIPVNIQDEPAYRGMLIMGYHNSLTALTSLDLPVLARRCKGHENL